MSLGFDLRLQRDGFELRAAAELDAGITALLGASGAGKSSLLAALAGTLPDARGRIVLAGRSLLDSAAGVLVPAEQRRVGMVYQDLRLFPHKSVYDNLVYGQAAARRAMDFSRMVEVLGLQDLLTRRPRQLSGGEQQRVALGRALCSGPDLLLMDEPLAALDGRRRREILAYLRWVHEEWGIPILYVSHALNEVLELTEHALLLDGGALVAQGEVFEVLGHGALEMAGFGIASALPVVIDQVHEEGDSLRGKVGEQVLTLPFARCSPGQIGRVLVAPDDVILARDELSGISARNQLRGRVQRVSSLHGRLLVHLELGPEAVLRAELTASAMAELGVEPGQELVCVVKTSAFRWQALR